MIVLEISLSCLGLIEPTSTLNKLFQLLLLVCIFVSRNIVYRNTPDFVYTPIINYHPEDGYNFGVDFNPNETLGKYFPGKQTNIILFF